MKNITIEDCENLRKQFLTFCESAEQHQFPMLFIMHMKLDESIDRMKAAGSVTDQKEARSMFRVILKVIGQDYSEYEEATQ